MRRSRTVGLVTAALVITLSTALASDAARAGFRGLGFVDPQQPLSRANAVSPDGAVIVGRSGDRSVSWTASGAKDLGTFFRPGFWGNPGADSSAQAVSANGSTIVGNAYNGSFTSPDTVAYLWRDGATNSLGATAGRFEGFGARAISADGDRVVGNRGIAQPLAAGFGPGLPPIFASNAFLPLGSATGLSADGSIVVGSNQLVGQPSLTRAWVWSVGSGMTALDTLPGGEQNWAHAISADGQTVVGTSESSQGLRPVFWENGQVHELPLPADATSAQPLAVSGDGGVIVGSATGASGSRAVSWSNGSVVDLHRALSASESALEGWSLQAATGISAGGSTIVGFGSDPSGHTQAWAVAVPTPASVWVGLLMLAGITARRAMRLRVA